MNFKKENLIKSPLNYTGGKYKLLPQILPLIPDNINAFVDLFCGGGNVGINIEANNIILNDKEFVVMDFFNGLLKEGTTSALKKVEEVISSYGLSKTNEEGFKKIREDYNNGNRDWSMFYSMVTNAFNYQIRFNKNNEYNMPFGRDRSSFNPTLRGNFVKFSDKLSSKNIKLFNKDFRDIKVHELKETDFIYADPPYLVTCASYNEQEGWNESLERELLDILDTANDKGIRFALSNVFENKGKSNDILKEWSKKYNVHYLNNTYGNCNYHAKDKSSNSTIEVLITNY